MLKLRVKRSKSPKSAWFSREIPAKTNLSENTQLLCYLAKYTNGVNETLNLTQIETTEMCSFIFVCIYNASTLYIGVLFHSSISGNIAYIGMQ